MGLTMIKRYILGKLCNRLPPKALRRVYVSSLIAALLNRSKIDESILVRLNEILKLTKNVEALYLPILLHKIIWPADISTEVVVVGSRVLLMRDVLTATLNDDELKELAGVCFSRLSICKNYNPIIGTSDVTKTFKALRELHIT